VQARLYLGELRHGARIAPGLFRQSALLGWVASNVPKGISTKSS
jgi:hypothetical protein